MVPGNVPALFEMIPIEDLLREAQSAAKDSVPFNTARSYESDWKDASSFAILMVILSEKKVQHR